MRELDTLLEMRCDVNLTSCMDDLEKTEYLGAMLNVMKQVGATNHKAEPVKAYFSESETALRQRFDLVLYYDGSKSKRARNRISAMMVILFALSYFVIIQPAYFPPIEDLTDTHTVTEETSFILFDGKKYYLYIDNTYFSEVTEEELNDIPYNTLEIIEGSK